MLESMKLVKNHISKVPFRFWFLTNLYVFVMDPEDIQTILNSPNCFDRGLIYEFGDFFAKNGIGINKIHRWKQSRKTLNPVFSTKACQGYLKIFNEEISVMVSRMKDICKNHEPGYETSTVTSLFCILAMAMFPEHQERIFEEIKTTLPNLQDYVEYEDLNKCEFLDRFIKETLRLFPSLPLIVRSVEKATQIGQYTVPAGTQLIIPLIFLHREKSFWGPTAEEFDPDRFLPENIEKVNPHAYLPFAGGPKICIGIKYANTCEN
ncbi:probable cytochrome P450 313a4 [Lutzomyia longipalpis]|uniref:probable cytochrome P450 313a4 n=1 Tax=Lutzomyia longipalpis TaxID=7200 RepID=UPI00248455D5|nr:probable cytochrome P450 313a4 [Lutzomyia longipalpis]